MRKVEQYGGPGILVFPRFLGIPEYLGQALSGPGTKQFGAPVLPPNRLLK